MRARESGVFIALFVLCVFLSFATDGFLTSVNLFNVGRQISLLGIMSVGMTFVLISGEVDLSVGSNYAFSGLLTGMLIIAGWALTPALCVGVLAGAAIGLINGLLSTYGRLPSLDRHARHAEHRAGRRAHHDERPAGDGEHPQWRCAGRFERLRIHGTGLRARRRSDAARVLRPRRRSRLGRPVIHEFRVPGLRCRRQRKGCASGRHRRLSREDLGHRS